MSKIKKIIIFFSIIIIITISSFYALFYNTNTKVNSSFDSIEKKTISSYNLQSNDINNHKKNIDSNSKLQISKPKDNHQKKDDSKKKDNSVKPKNLVINDKNTTIKPKSSFENSTNKPIKNLEKNIIIKNNSCLSYETLINIYKTTLNDWISTFEMSVKDPELLKEYNEKHKKNCNYYKDPKFNTKEDLSIFLSNYFCKNEVNRLIDELGFTKDNKFYLLFGQLGSIPRFEENLIQLTAIQNGNKITLTLVEKNISPFDGRVLDPSIETLTLVKENNKWVFEKWFI